MVVSYINSKLLQHYKTYSRAIVYNNEPCALKNRLIRKLTSTQTISNQVNNHMFDNLGTMVVTPSSNTVSSTTVNTCPKVYTLLAILAIAVFMYKFRKITCVASIAMCYKFLRIERAPFSDRRHLVFQKHTPLPNPIPQVWLDKLVEYGRKDRKLLPPTHRKTLRVMSIACKLGQGMHEVLGQNTGFKIVAYEPGNNSCPVLTMAQRTRKKRLNHRVGLESSSYIDRGYRAKNLEGLVWRVVVINSKTFTAFSGPFNTLFIHTDLINRCSDEELAFVIGHEMGHIIAQHNEYIGMRNPLKDIIKEAVMLLAFLFSSDPYLPEEEIKDVINNFECRRNEYEADQIGMMLMASAGYDPRGAPMFISKYLTCGSSTHPTGLQRAGYLENPKRMKKAMGLYRDVSVGYCDPKLL